MRSSPSEGDVRAAKQELTNRYLVGLSSTFVARSMAMRGPTIPGANVVDNVVGVGVAEKVVHQSLAGTLCVKVYVQKKYPPPEIQDDNRIPQTINGIPTDVEEVGRIRAWQLPCTRERRHHLQPAPCGVSVGHMRITAGTIGALVRGRGRVDDGRRYILSNNHVLANSNAAEAGDAILQPGPLDGGTPAASHIGRLARFVPINFAGGENTVDCAIAEVEPGTVLSEICSLGTVCGATLPQRDITVFKHGRTTGLTRGVITDVDADIRVDYDEAGVGLFINTIVIRGLPPTTPFSNGGDSGSMILDSQRRACALLFAGASGADVTFANSIQPVLRRLRIHLV
jgi:hypothetical protein